MSKGGLRRPYITYLQCQSFLPGLLRPGSFPYVMYGRRRPPFDMYIHTYILLCHLDFFVVFEFTSRKTKPKSMHVWIHRSKGGLGHPYITYVQRSQVGAGQEGLDLALYTYDVWTAQAAVWHIMYVFTLPFVYMFGCTPIVYRTLPLVEG